MVRQFLQGQNFFLQEFGKMCSEVVWELAPQTIPRGHGDLAEAAPLRAESLIPAVLAARHVWLLSTAPPDHARLWHQALPDPETELELGQLLSSKQAPGVRGQGLDPTWPTQPFPECGRPVPGSQLPWMWIDIASGLSLASALPFSACSTIPFSGRGWMAPECWSTSHLETHMECRAVWRR